MNKSIKSKKNKTDDIISIINNYITQFIELKIANNVSNNTILNYRRALEYFYEFVADEYENGRLLYINDINNYFISAYVQFLKSKGLNPRSQQNYLITAKNLIKFISDSDIKNYRELKHGISSFNVKFESKEPNYFTNDEINKIINLAAKLDLSDKFLDLRNSLILKMQLFTGIRISEMLNITWNDIEENDNSYMIRIVGKGNKQRFTYLPKDRCIINIEYLKSLKISDYLFSSKNGNQIDRKNAWSLIKLLLRKINVNKTGIHIFRHSLARMLLNDNVNLETIREILGHADVATTARIYAKADEKNKRVTLLNNVNNNLNNLLGYR